MTARRLPELRAVRYGSVEAMHLTYDFGGSALCGAGPSHIPPVLGDVEDAEYCGAVCAACSREFWRRQDEDDAREVRP